jgi:hypothetical protein
MAMARTVERGGEQVISFDVTEIAQMARKTLKLAFPGVKFSVKSKRGSTYGGLDVAWQDGPTSAQVDAELAGFRGSEFDGYQDLRIDLVKPIGGVQAESGANYISTIRTLSLAFVKPMAERVAAQYGRPVPQLIEYSWGCTADHDYSWTLNGQTLVDLIFAEARNTSATGPAKTVTSYM